jgi:acyl-CoA reductase-like NAD-dependent aldehyde dehydrogenase
MYYGGVMKLKSRFSNIDEVLMRVNKSKFGLACGVFAKDTEFAHSLTNRIDAGFIWINSYNIVPPYLPFGGFKHSGVGKELGMQSLDSFTVFKSVYSKRY